MTKQDLINGIAASTGKSIYDSKLIFEAALDIIADALMEGEEITIRNFGAFRVKTMAPRTVRNINTGEQYVMGASKKIVFEASKNIKAE